MKAYQKPSMELFSVQPVRVMATSSGSLPVNDEYSGDDELSGSNALVRSRGDVWDQEW